MLNINDRVLINLDIDRLNALKCYTCGYHLTDFPRFLIANVSGKFGTIAGIYESYLHPILKCTACDSPIELYSSQARLKYIVELDNILNHINNNGKIEAIIVSDKEVSKIDNIEVIKFD